MFSWLNRCWSGMGITSKFERARINCTYADWSVPSNSDILVILASFKGEDSRIQPEDAFKALITNLQRNDQRFHDAFILKNLLLLDLIVEERIFLKKIASYYNNQIVYMNRSDAGEVKELIMAYYEYIKEKAKNYEQQPQDLIQKEERVTYMTTADIKSILIEVNHCFKIQNNILIISQKYQKGNKSLPLIRFIYSFLFKTFLFCYSIVSLGIKTLLEKISLLNSHDLSQFSRLIKYYNNQYSQNFLIFIEQNKSIAEFKAFKYNEVIKIDDKIYKAIEYQQNQLSQNRIQLLENQPQLVVDIEQTETNFSLQSGQKTRKRIDVQQKRTQAQELSDNFNKYVNFYSDKFIINSVDQNVKSGFKVANIESMYLEKEAVINMTSMEQIEQNIQQS